MRNSVNLSKNCYIKLNYNETKQLAIKKYFSIHYKK